MRTGETKALVDQAEYIRTDEAYKHPEAMDIAGVRKRKPQPMTPKQIAIVRNIRKAERQKRNAAKIAPAVKAWNEKHHKQP